jgi:hypothetical protein
LEYQLQLEFALLSLLGVPFFSPMAIASKVAHGIMGCQSLLLSIGKQSAKAANDPAT